MGLPQHLELPAGAPQGDIADLLAAVRGAEADALAAAGRDDLAVRALARRIAQDREALEALRRQTVAAELAAEHARHRAAAESAAEALAAERAHAERMLEIAARERVDAEARALSEARRREAAEAELALAAAARSRREAAALEAERERLAVEQHALQMTRDRIRDEQVAEAAVLARLAAANDANSLAGLRAVDAQRAEVARQENLVAHAALHAAAAMLPGDGLSSPPIKRWLKPGATPAPSGRLVRGDRVPARRTPLAVLAVGLAVIIGLGLGTLAARRMLGDPAAAGAVERDGGVVLRLDTRLRDHR